MRIIILLLVLCTIIACRQPESTPEPATAPVDTQPSAPESSDADTGVEEIDTLESELDDSELQGIEDDLASLDW